MLFLERSAAKLIVTQTVCLKTSQSSRNAPNFQTWIVTSSAGEGRARRLHGFQEARVKYFEMIYNFGSRKLDFPTEITEKPLKFV